MVTYIEVKLKLSEKRFVVRVCNWCLTGKSSVCKNSSFRHSNTSPRSKETKKLFQRVSFIIFTDLLCWTPLRVAEFVVASHPTRITSGTDIIYTAFSLQSAMLLAVAFNSILNPCIYTLIIYGKNCLRK